MPFMRDGAEEPVGPLVLHRSGPWLYPGIRTTKTQAARCGAPYAAGRRTDDDGSRFKGLNHASDLIPPTCAVVYQEIDTFRSRHKTHH